MLYETTVRTILASCLGFGILLIGGCAPSTKACSAGGGCPTGQACVVGKCSAEDGASLITATSRRLLMQPAAIEYVTSDDVPTPLGGAIVLGGEVGTRTRIFLRFSRGDFGRSEVQRAFLILERAEAATAGPQSIMLRAARLLEPWSPREGARPRWSSSFDAEPIGELLARPTSKGALRIDVTRYALELTRDAVVKKLPSYGLRIEGEGPGYGLPIASGALGGVGPVLEIYLQ